MTNSIEPNMKVIDAAENMLIAFAMGWDMDGTIEVFDEATEEFQAADHSSKPCSDEGKLCEQVIKSAMTMRMGIRSGLSRDQIDGDANNLGLAITAIEHLRTPVPSPGAP